MTASEIRDAVCFVVALSSVARWAGALLPLVVLASAASGAEQSANGYREKVNLGGIEVEFRLSPLDRSHGLSEGRVARFQFTLSDAASGTPLSGVFPAAWMDRRLPEESQAAAVDDRACSDKVKMLLGGSFMSRAELDLNLYYVLAMNEDATLSVVDPLFSFGDSQLLAIVPLRSPASDWVLSPERGRIFVSLPESDAVAVVETRSWQVVTNIPTGPEPRRLLLQNDGAYLWAGYDRAEPGETASGVTVVQTSNLAVRTRIATGRGHHELAVSSDDQFVFVTNADDGSVSVIDVRKLELARTLSLGGRPTSIAWCQAARSVYVADSETGDIVAIDAGRHEIVARMHTRPGLGAIRCSPEGRLAFAVNPAEDLLHIIDTSTNRIVQTGPVADGPDQLAFSDSLAYIRHSGTDTVLMVPLSEVGKPNTPIPVVDFPGGLLPPGSGPGSLAPSIVQAPGANAVLVANPADGTIYYYMEGMAAPIGAFENYGRKPRAVMVVDNSLRERAPGVYETTAQLRRPGRYDIAFFLDAPRSVHCFSVEIAADPALEAKRARRPLQVTALLDGSSIRVARGEETRVILEVVDPGSGKPRPGLEDLVVMAMLAPGRWHARQLARDLGDGRYEVRFRVPEEGLYYLYAECASEGLALGASRPLAYIQVHAEDSADTASARDSGGLAP